jgi:hypothetical protein
MSGMKSATVVILGVAVAMCVLATTAQAQNGSIEFVARATPSGGLEEPVRGFPFFLLSKSFEQISKEVDATHPQPDMDAFIDGLEVTKELKAWMKKSHWLQLTGEDFIHKLAPADIVNVPEFYSAYMARNLGSEQMGFPKPKYKSSDQAKDPAKYDKLVQDYHQAIQHYIEANPESKDGMDLELSSKDPSPKWQALVAKRSPAIRHDALQLARSKYLVAQTQTNLQGEGFLKGIAPGNYWLTTLDVTADVGDVHARWDVPVSVGPGQAAHVALSNVNAVQQPTSHDSP